SPHWPEGLHGSISHDTGLAVAALCQGGAAFGIDLASAAPLDRALWNEIATPQELDQGTTGFDRGEIARLVFSAKEAAYKAQFPASGAVLGFDAMRIEVGQGGLVARLMREAGPYAAGTAFRGGWARIGDRLVVLMQAPAPAAAAQPGFASGNTASPGRARMVRRAGVS
ncbi:4'-phosphopantetheinyl transferase superfamily protein, partial [Limimaricola sp. ASW11-118]